MKKALLFAVLMVVYAAVFAQEKKEVTTGAGYANDVYYSLENGTITTVQRDNWDIGFTTSQMNISILANNGSGVELYTFTNGDTASWVDLDTTGMIWKPLYNSLETWEEGAFTSNAIPGDDFDYGWGRYDMVSHEIYGDSLFILKTVAGEYMKIWIRKKAAMLNTWEFKYASLDGSEEMIVDLDANDYPNPSFVYYSLDSAKFQQREPATEEWDMLFTKFLVLIPNEEGLTPYSVTGALTNEDHIVAQEVRESGMDQSTHNSFEESEFSSEISVIGSDWKEFDMGAFAYIINDTVVYYLKSFGETDSAYYKVYFTGFTGMSEGKYIFTQEKLIDVTTAAPQNVQLLEVYPNPASHQLNVVFDYQGEISMSVVDVTGRTVHSSRYISGGFTNQILNIAELNPGLLFLKLEAEGEAKVVRFIKE